jgi:UDP-N-acetyl-D-glucosamine dehydrogenase
LFCLEKGITKGEVIMQSIHKEGAAPEIAPVGDELERKIRDRSAKVGVIGLGYVGLPLMLEMAKAGFQVTGIDIDRQSVDAVNAGISYVLDVPSETLLSFVAEEKIKATPALAAVENLDAISICVPTPLRKTKDPDLSYVVAAVEAVRKHLRPRQLIILESTTYPGTTSELVQPTLEATGLRAGRDFFLAYSPERVDPGNKSYTTRNIPKVIGGVTLRCTELATLFYQQMIETIVPVSSPETAEMVKLLENTYRSVNIALANEMALTCRKLKIDVWEVIEAAKTKPFGFTPFYPGPGLGGHCIPIDPCYLTWRARMNGFEPRLIELAGQINSQMPAFTVSRIADVLNERQKSLKGSKILALGVTYKRDTSDVRESPAIEVLRGLREKGAVVYFSDPYVPSLEIDGQVTKSADVVPEVLQSVDCVVLLTDHTAFDYGMVAKHASLILDTRHVMRDFSTPNTICL